MNSAVIFAVHLTAFLGVGLLGSTILAKKKIIQDQYALIVAYAISCLVGLVLFFVYAYNPDYGTIGSGAFYLVGFTCFITLSYLFGKDPSYRRVVKKHVAPPLVLILVVCLFYSAITLSCTHVEIPDNNSYNVYQSCALNKAPGDNILPEFFGDRLIENKEGVLAGDWRLGDRPPLQIGSVISLLDIIPNDASKLAAYQVFSTFLQLGWIAGLWALLKSMRLKKSAQDFVLFISVFTGFYYYNSIYVWPKLLAAGFAISAISLLLYNNHDRELKSGITPFDWSLIATLLALALLAHGSIIFTLIPLGIYFILKRKLPSARILLLAFSVGSLLYAPWVIYQVHSHSGDRLAKWHLAGVIKPDNRSAAQTIKDSYSSTSLNNLLDSKSRNIEALFRSDPSLKSLHAPVVKDPSTYSIIDSIRRQEFFALIPALGLFNLGWFVAIRLRKKNRIFYLEIRPLILLGLSSVAIWTLLMFIPGSTIVHQNSYGTMMLLFTFLILVISQLSSRVRVALSVLQILLFSFIWIIYTSRENQESELIAMALSLLGIIVVWLVVYFERARLWIAAKRV